MVEILLDSQCSFWQVKSTDSRRNNKKVYCIVINIFPPFFGLNFKRHSGHLKYSNKLDHKSMHLLLDLLEIIEFIKCFKSQKVKTTMWFNRTIHLLCINMLYMPHTIYAIAYVQYQTIQPTIALCEIFHYSSFFSLLSQSSCIATKKDSISLSLLAFHFMFG